MSYKGRDLAPTNKATDLPTANIANSCTEGFEYCEILESCIEPAGERGKCPDDLFDSLQPTNSDFCDYCITKDGGVGDKEIKYCNQICYTPYSVSSMSLFRSDIVSLVTKQRFENSFAYHSDRGWYPLYGYYFNPSVVLLSIIQRILHDAGYANNINGMVRCMRIVSYTLLMMLSTIMFVEGLASHPPLLFLVLSMSFALPSLS